MFVFAVVVVVVALLAILIRYVYYREYKRRREENKDERMRIAWKQLHYLAQQHRRDEMNGLGEDLEEPISWGD